MAQTTRGWLFVSSFVTLVLVTAAAPAAEIVELRGRTMGTTYHVKGVDVGDPDELQQRIDRRLDEINGLMSTYVEDSEVSRFNRTPAGEWFAVSAETLSVVELGQAIARQSEGAFDMTVAPLVRLWSFGAGVQAGDFVPPAPADVQAALAIVGFDKLEVRSDPAALRKRVDGVQIDLSAIAKGYAVDQVAEVIQARGVTDFMVEIGGEVSAAGVRPDGRPWQIGIEAPDPETRRLETLIPLQDQALASSGDYRNFHEYRGKRYSHTIDPRTGWPVEHDLSAVSVVAANCTTADALATALLVLGREEGSIWAEQHDVDALFLSRTENGIEHVRTAHFPAQRVAAPDESQPQSSFTGLFVMSAVIFGIALLAMSIGVVVNGRRLRGSCGGLAGLKDEHGDTLCDACTNPSPTCQGEPLSDTDDGRVS